MLLLCIAFITMLLFTFGVVSFFLRPTAEQKAVDGRMAVIKSSGGGSSLPGGALDELLKATQDNSFGWIERLLHSYQFSRKTELLILQANSATTVGTLIFTSLSVSIAGFLICYLFIPVVTVAALVALLLAYVPTAILSFRRRRRAAAFNAVLPDTMDMMARALRAGHSLVGSLSIIAEQSSEPAKSEFGEVFKQQNYGLPLRDALMQLLERIPSQDLRVVVTAILVQKDTGGNLVEILDRTVFVVRERLRIQGEIRIHTAQGRMTGWVLCMLPIVMLLLINLINPGYSSVMLSDPFGRKLLYLGLGLLAVGGFLIRQIVNGIEV